MSSFSSFAGELEPNKDVAPQIRIRPKSEAAIPVGQPEKVVLVVESEKHELDDSIYESLDKYEKPKEIIFIPKFLDTVTGKILRKETLNK